MHRGVGLRQVQLWVGQTVMKTVLLMTGILLASAALGLLMYTSAQADSPPTPDTVAPGASAATGRAPQSAVPPTFKARITPGDNLDGLFECNDTLFLPPNAKLDLWATGEQQNGRFSASPDFSAGKNIQNLDAPAHAQFNLNATPGDTFQIVYAGDFRLNVVVLYPAKHTISKTGDITIHVDGTSLGSLRDAHKCGTKLVKEHVDCYVAPDYFAKITAENRGWHITPHIKIGQMIAPATRWVNNKKVFTDICHTEYFAPNRPLMEKLEQVACALEKENIQFKEWEVNSGYRTPAYNKSIGGATFSRHAWGDAVDIMIDENKDHRMDDLNGDQRSDRHDGILIAKIADRLEIDGKVAKGGIGVYQFDSDQSVGCHVHIDVRGYVVRWGQFGIGRHARPFTWWPESSYDSKDGGGE